MKVLMDGEDQEAEQEEWDDILLAVWFCGLPSGPPGLH